MSEFEISSKKKKCWCSGFLLSNSDIFLAVITSKTSQLLVLEISRIKYAKLYFFLYMSFVWVSVTPTASLPSTAREHNLSRHLMTIYTFCRRWSLFLVFVPLRFDSTRLTLPAKTCSSVALWKLVWSYCNFQTGAFSFFSRKVTCIPQTSLLKSVQIQSRRNSFHFG